MTAAEDLLRMQAREARAQGAREIGRQFGNVLAGIVVGAVLALAFAWAAWLFVFAATTSWAILVSPSFVAGAVVVVYTAVILLWRLFHPKVKG